MRRELFILNGIFLADKNNKNKIQNDKIKNQLLRNVILVQTNFIFLVNRSLQVLPLDYRHVNKTIKT